MTQLEPESFLSFFLLLRHLAKILFVKHVTRCRLKVTWEQVMKTGLEPRHNDIANAITNRLQSDIKVATKACQGYIQSISASNIDIAYLC